MRQHSNGQHPSERAGICRRTARLLKAVARGVRNGPPTFFRDSLSRLPQLALASVLVCSGCSTTENTPLCDLHWWGQQDELSYYRGRNSAIEYPCLDNETAHAVQVSEAPRNLHSRTEDQPREITLHEAIQTALSHNEVIETSALGGIGAKQVLTNPQTAASVYDAAIQESGVLFGRRGLEAALSDFDARFNTSMTWGRSDAVFNGTPTGVPNSRETAAFQTSVAKQFANGGSMSISHNWDYLGTSAAGTLLPSSYAGSLGFDYRLPLLQGSGVAYTRIAGPARPGLGAITGVSQGVSIARINQDVTLAEFEIAVRDGVRDIEYAYWDLYLANRSYDTATVAFQSAFQTWREAQDRLEVGVLKPADELQARDRLYETKASVETSLNLLYKAETELRRLIGLPMNDGFVLVPIDEPAIAELIPDWQSALSEALTRRTELRRQKWNIKSLQLQLQAARSLVRPRLDLTAGYGANAFGDQLFGSGGAPIDGGYDSLLTDNLGTWGLGFEFEVPIGYRFARSQVRSFELQVAKATAVLASQEKNIAHDVATSIQDLTASYAAAQSNLSRLQAAARRVELLETERDVGTLTLDLVLRAQDSVAAAEGRFYLQLVNYNKAIVDLNLSTGTLLEQNGIMLAEGQWDSEAYCQAQIRAAERTHGIDNPHLYTEPSEFSSPGPTGSVELRPSTTLPRTDPAVLEPATGAQADEPETSVDAPNVDASDSQRITDG